MNQNIINPENTTGTKIHSHLLKKVRHGTQTQETMDNGKDSQEEKVRHKSSETYVGYREHQLEIIADRLHLYDPSNYDPLTVINFLLDLATRQYQAGTVDSVRLVVKWINRVMNYYQNYLEHPTHGDTVQTRGWLTNVSRHLPQLIRTLSDLRKYGKTLQGWNDSLDHIQRVWNNLRSRA